MNTKLASLQKSIRWGLIISWICNALAYAAPLFGVLWLSGLFHPAWTASLAVFVFFLLGFRNYHLGKSRWPTRERLANHLDREHPELEESADLLWRSQEELAPLQKMQKARISQRLSSLPLEKALPKRRLKQAWQKAALGVVMGILLLIGSSWVPRDLAQQGVASLREAFSGPRDTVLEEITVRQWQIDLMPPVYTKLEPRKSEIPAVKVVQGSKVNWEISLSRRVDDLIVHHRPGESIRLGPGKRFSWGFMVNQPGYYYLEFLKDGNSQMTAYFPLEIVTDQPPRLTVLEPATIRTDIAEGSRNQFRVALEATDDFGLAAGQLVVTVAKGSGENVKFRERTWPLSGWEGGSLKEKKLHAVLDFAQWEATWGDELYFHIEMTDNKEPEPNKTRSDTYFLVLLGGDRPMELDTEGMVLRPVRAYFRSQRQIIIDTEKLLAQRSEMSEKAFRERSEILGVDQKILRLRYGQFLGEEFETAIDIQLEPPQVADGHDHEHDHGHESEALPEGVPGHNHDEANESGFQEMTLVTENIQDLLPEGLMHDHDDAETSTFFEPEMKAKLKDALSEMWQSELYLRTIEPRKSLPYQYRALKMIKELQQMSRVYVQRVGIETPPLQPEKKRLTGERTKMAELKAQQKLRKEDPHADLRRAWQGFQAKNVDVDLLTKIAPKLERAAQKDPAKFLEALEAFNEYLRSPKDCGDCGNTIAAALWMLLPEAHPEPKVRTLPRQDLSKSYLRELGQRP